MRGTIDYVSESGRGTTFFVELPLYGVVATATRAEPSRTT
jgi:signal transduction histidine kinase